MTSQPPTAETRRYAHEIAPRPSLNTPRERMAATMYAHHAARAQALWKAVLDGTIPGNPDGTWAIEPAYQEWLITVLLGSLIAGEDANTVAVDILANGSSPHTMGEFTWELCERAGIDPDTVRPYVRDDVLPKDRVAPAETPEAPTLLLPGAVLHALKQVIAEADYDLHKGIECSEDDGSDRYPALVEQFTRAYEAALAGGEGE